MPAVLAIVTAPFEALVIVTPEPATKNEEPSDNFVKEPERAGAFIIVPLTSVVACIEPVTPT